jgi:hypothetical protein
MDLGSVRETFQRLEETLQICLQMRIDKNGPHRGNYYELDEHFAIHCLRRGLDRRSWWGRRRTQNPTVGGALL